MKARTSLLIGALMLSICGVTHATAPQSSHLVVIVGAAGDDTYREVFHRWALELIELASAQMGLSADQVIYLGEDPETNGERVAAQSNRENIELTLTELASELRPDDQLFLVLIGHGSGVGEQSKFNIPGRDLNALDYDALLDLFVTQRVAFINTASASGDFVALLSAPNRVIVTATRDARQNNQTVFARFFVGSFSPEVADLDKDARVSLLEAYSYTSREVQRFYEDDGRMLTETAQIDDNGDGVGSHDPDAPGADGSLARALFLDDPAATAVAGGGPDDPALRALYDEQRQLREQIEALKVLKSSMDPDLYSSELEKLLVALARKDQEIRDKGGR